MNKFFKITLYILSVTFSQVALSETIESRSFELYLEKCLMAQTLPQAIFDETIVVDSANSNNIMIVLYEDKLKIYANPKLEEFQEIQELFADINKNDAAHIYSDSNDPIFHTPVINLDEIYYYNAKNCFINAEFIAVQDCIIESPNIVLKAKEIEIESFLIDVQTIELQSNNTLSLLSSIKLTLKDKDDFKFQPLITGIVDFDDNVVMLICSSVSKVELRCLPGSFYFEENAICFN